MQDIRELFQIFVRRFGLLNASCCDCCCEEEVSLVQSHILYEINRRESPSMQQVAEALGMDITTFSRQIKNLEQRGLVCKSLDPGDRRVSVLSLTENGHRVEKSIDDRMRSYIDKILAEMTDFERDMVIKSIQLLNKTIEKSGCCCLC
ncbi:MAG: MarR family transcriptional regulator [Thermincola sp.]|nr:MarR family transcriptional regulator [Thermincola sp.]